MVGITEVAAEKVKEVMASQERENLFLRVYVAGFGCGGPNLGLALDDNKTEDDHVDEAFGVTIVTEKKLAQFVEGSIIDYTESNYGAGFEIKNPNQTDCSTSCGGSCGC